MKPFWYKWPSVVVELIAGVLLALFVQVVPWWFWRIVAALALSLVYEAFIDPNAGELYHDPYNDMAERAVGILLGLLLWSWIL